MNHPQKNNRNGLSLIEVVVSSLLVGTVVVGSLEMLGASVRTQTSANDRIDGPRLAEMLIAEIMTMPYDEPDGAGPKGLDSGESGGDRADFDDVDDYQGWSESTIQAKNGTPLPNTVGWTRTADVWWVDRANGNVWIIHDTGLKRFTVTVTSPDGVVTECRGMRGRWGILEQPPTVDKTVVTLIEATLAVGSATESRQSTNLMNHVEDPNAN